MDSHDALAAYLRPNGYYDSRRILIDAGVPSLDATFRAFWSGDGPDPDARVAAPLPEPYEQLYRAAEAHNRRLDAEREAQRAAEGRRLLAQPEPWSYATWQQLQALGLARIAVEGGEDEGGLSWSANLTAAGERVNDPRYVPPGIYADQVEE